MRMRPRQEWCKALNKRRITYHRTLSLRFSARSSSNSKKLIQSMTLSAYFKKWENHQVDQLETRVRMEKAKTRVTSLDS